MRNDLTQRLKVGDLLLISTGEYSDYRVDGPVRVIREFVKQNVCDAFRAEYSGVDKWGDENKPRSDDFLPWLVSQGYVEAVDNATEWHVDYYGEFCP